MARVRSLKFMAAARRNLKKAQVSRIRSRSPRRDRRLGAARRGVR